MAYIPPNKRHSRDKGIPSPTPRFYVPQFRRNLNIKPSEFNIKKSGKIVYADQSISRWFAVGLDVNDQFPSCINLEPISLASVQPNMGEKPLILVNSQQNQDESKPRDRDLRNPWEIIAENVLQDLLSSFRLLSSEMEHQGLEIVKPTLVARFGKMRFHGSPSLRLESVEKTQVTETTLRQLKRSLYTNVSPSYMESVIDAVVPKIGVDFEEEKDVYHVKLSDNSRPDATLSCKCSVREDKKLLLYKVELNQVRHMVTDMSCLDKNLDLRLMLCSKRILTALTDDEIDIIRNLIDSAVLDSDVKGGLKWPLGKTSSGDRFSVVGVWHTTAKAYKNKSIRLKVRHADRYDFRSGKGEASREIYLKLKGLVSELQERGVKSESISTMLEDNLRLIWNHFFICEPF